MIYSRFADHCQTLGGWFGPKLGYASIDCSALAELGAALALILPRFRGGVLPRE